MDTWHNTLSIRMTYTQTTAPITATTITITAITIKAGLPNYLISMPKSLVPIWTK
ncbi:hypothetical protein GCM10027402_09290 [Arthrobacter monumenti]